MVIDEGLLRQARDAAGRMADAQRQADVAKADYHHAVRRIHYAGASLREIADALELSHQRVHQIIESTGGTGGWKSSRKHRGNMSCSFCGRSDAEVDKLIAGPGIFICDECVTLVRRVTDQSVSAETMLTRLDRLPPESTLKCNFCGKARSHVTTMVAGNRFSICGECIQLCEEILAAAT
jgi:hypothetical protein